MSQFARLAPAVQAELQARVTLREHRFSALEKPGGEKPCNILIIGDRPAPSAPSHDGFVYTPFGALKHSSLWLNLQLHEAGIPERKLAWVNAADRHGNPTDPEILTRGWKHLVFLGDKAERWELRSGAKHNAHVYKVPHPQFWKRFRSKDPYPLVDLLLDLLLPDPRGGLRDSYRV